LDRESELAATLAEMQQATQDKNPASALAARRALVRKYPGVETRLDAATQAVVKLQASLASVVDQSLTPATPAPAVVREIVLAQHEGTAAAGSADKIAAFALGGAIYACDAASGQLRWRHFLSRESHDQPVLLSGEENGDII